jgi:hypothetical protein
MELVVITHTWISIAVIVILRSTWLLGLWLRLHFEARAQDSQQKYFLDFTKALPSRWGSEQRLAGDTWSSLNPAARAEDVDE